MDTNMSITSMVIGVEMIKAAQEQGEMALKLIQSASVQSDTVSSPVDTTPPAEIESVGGEQRIDIRI